MKSLLIAVAVIFAFSASPLMAKGSFRPNSPNSGAHSHASHPHKPVNHRVWIPETKSWFYCQWDKRPTYWGPWCE